MGVFWGLGGSLYGGGVPIMVMGGFLNGGPYTWGSPPTSPLPSPHIDHTPQPIYGAEPLYKVTVMDIWGSFGVRGGSRPYLFPPEPPRRPTEGRPQALHGAVGGRHGAAGAAAAQSHGEEDAGVAPYGAAPQRPTLVAQRPISARRLGGGAQRAAIHRLLWGGG